MTDLLAVGHVCDSEGLVQQATARGEVVEVMWVPALNYLKRQAPAQVRFEHDGPLVGSVVTYERSRRWGLLATMALSADNADILAKYPWYLSPLLHTVGFDDMHRERGEILELAIVARPGNTGTRPLVAAPLDVALSPAALPPDWRDVWDRAKERARMARYRPAREYLEVDDRDPLSVYELIGTDLEAGRRELALMRSRLPEPPEPAVVTEARARAAAEARRDDPSVVRRRTFTGANLHWVD